MNEDRLTEEEKRILLDLARKALDTGVRGQKLLPLDLQTLPPRLQAHGCSFVTLTIEGNLRGCIGGLEPCRPLAEDVREHAVAAALQDFRFPAVRAEELPRIKLEISRLTVPVPLAYSVAEDLLSKLRPGLDGIVIRDGPRRATFLPQVWKKLPETTCFLDNLCTKMGTAPDLWRKKHLDVLVYQVEEFQE